MTSTRALLLGGFCLALGVSLLADNPIVGIGCALFVVTGVYFTVVGVLLHRDAPEPRPAKHRHTFGAWKTARQTTTTGRPGLAVEQERTCSECGYIETRTP